MTRPNIPKQPKQPNRHARRFAGNEAWWKTRAVHLMTYPECRACGTREDVVVHHLRYRGKRGESEKPGDLMTLCAYHHNEYHRLHGMVGLVENSIAYVEYVAQQLLWTP